MSIENIEKFNQAVAENPELQTRLQDMRAQIARATAEKIAALGHEAGVAISADDLMSASEELSDEALEHVAGGNKDVAGRVAVSIFTAGLACLIMYQNSRDPSRHRPEDCM